MGYATLESVAGCGYAKLHWQKKFPIVQLRPEKDNTFSGCIISWGFSHLRLQFRQEYYILPIGKECKEFKEFTKYKGGTLWM